MSARQQERLAYRRKRTVRRAAVGVLSTVLVLGTLVWIIINAPGWERVRATFFSADHAKASLPQIAEAFWLNIALFTVIELLVLPLALLIAVIRVIPSPAMMPFKILSATSTLR